jgi:hypothetical protein
MCAERDPLDCHRGILIAPRINGRVGSLLHIGTDGDLESHSQAEARLMSRLHLPDRGLFHSHDELLANAYHHQEVRIAWKRREESHESDAV